MNFLTFISQRFRQFFFGESDSTKETESKFENREKVVAFGIALFFALCLWLIVNLSRDFNIVVQVPVIITNLSDDMTISSDIPENVSVNLSGEGWKLIPVYRNPPGIVLNAELRQINIPEQIRNQINAFADLNILQVNPSQLQIETERKESKRVPVVNRVDITFREQFGLLRAPVIAPDSVTVTGAESKIAALEYWETEPLDFTNVNRSFETEIDLRNDDAGVAVFPEKVTLMVDAAEFTEAEQRVPIRTRNLPNGRAVTYNPSSITIRFDVPIEQYSEIQNTRLFSAYVDYAVIEQDDSGRIAPRVEIEETDFVVRQRSFQPPRVSYFRIVSDETE